MRAPRAVLCSGRGAFAFVNLALPEGKARGVRLAVEEVNVVLRTRGRVELASHLTGFGPVRASSLETFGRSQG